MIKVSIKYMGQLATSAGKLEESLNIDESLTVASLIKSVAEDYGDPLKPMLVQNDELIMGLMIAVNDEQIIDAGTETLKNGDSIMLISPMAGG